MEERTYRNEAALTGIALAAPSFSHESHGTRFLHIPMQVLRLSGQADVLPVLAAEKKFSAAGETAGRRITVRGQLRSRNNKSGVGNRLLIAVLAETIKPTQDEDENRILLRGALCKAPVFRRTPLGREICDFMLAVNRRCGRSDYLPCIAWGALAQRLSRCSVGREVCLSGRLQSRAYSKVLEGQTQQRTAYEVSVMEAMETTRKN